MTGTDLSHRSEPLDAVRGVAISMVIACHYFGFTYGVFGVDLFFVLSGFLIGGILLDSCGQPGYFTSFYGRRAFRILPLYWLLLLVATPDHWGYYLPFAQMIPWIKFGYPLQEPTFVTWSLALEEQFYLILPAMIYWLPRRWLVIALWSGVLLAPPLRWLFDATLPHPSWEYLLPGRLDSLFGGALLACLMRGYCRSPPIWIILACIAPLCDIAYCLIVRPLAPFSIAAVIFCAMVWSAATSDKKVFVRPLIWLGRRCYALYLFHMLAIDAFFYFGFGEVSAILALPAVCLFAEISWRTIEAPLISYSKRRSQPVAIATG